MNRMSVEEEIRNLKNRPITLNDDFKTLYNAVMADQRQYGLYQEWIALLMYELGVDRGKRAERERRQERGLK